MWADGQHQIKRNGVVADSVPGPAHHRARWGISVVAHFDEAFASSLLELVDQVRPLCGETHTFYDASTLHTTVRACEFDRDGVGEQDLSVEGYREVLGGLCRRHAPFTVVYEGLNGNHTGIIAQGYALTGLRGFRLELHRQLTERGLHHGPEADGVRLTTHASLMVFGGPLERPRAVSGWLTARRKLPLGLARLSRLSLVKYRRTRSGVALLPLAEFELVG